ncbi:transcriptional regulator [Pseudodesulfovibrio sp.]|uniref:transcriptional regulator n=1 Tax=unclassified Pseudodesulfovibrio TaxID=2661612 RepID=UPI003B00C26D
MAQDKSTETTPLVDFESHVPDSMHPALEKAYRYRKAIASGVGAVLACAVIIAGWNVYSQRTEAKAQAALGTILLEKTGQDKITALEGLTGSVPSSVKPALLLELSEACMDAGDYTKAAGYWNDLAGYTEDDLNIVARLGQAKSLVLAGKPAEAVTILTDLQGTVDDEYTVPVNRQLAIAAEAAGNKATALTAYKALAEKQITDKPFVDYKIAQLEAK